MAPTPFENAVRADVKTYAEEIMACLSRDTLTGEPREAAVGALDYFVSEDDLVADNVPNIGLLDDAVALVSLARILVGRFDLGPLLTRERVVADHKRYMEKQGLMMTNMGAVTLGSLAYRGKKVDDEKTLFVKVRARLETL